MSTRRERAKEPHMQLNKQLAEKEEAVKMKVLAKKMSLRNAEIYTHMAEMVFGGIIIGGLFESGKSVIYLGVLYTLGIIGFVLLKRLGDNSYKHGIKE